MKQPKVKITDIHGKDYGIKPVVAMFWKEDKITIIQYDSVGEDNPSNFGTLYNYTGELLNSHGNLKGELIYG